MTYFAAIIARPTTAKMKPTKPSVPPATMVVSGFTSSTLAEANVIISYDWPCVESHR